MQELITKIERLVDSKILNTETKEAGRTRHKGSRLLPLSRSEEPKVGDFCRSIVVGKDEGKKQLILHITYLLSEGRSIYLNQLKLKGFICDYDLKQEFSIFTYVGNFKQVGLGSEIVAQVRSVVLKDEKKNYELTLKYKKSKLEGYFRPGISNDQVQIAPRDWKIYEKYGYFSAHFLAQYQEDFSNPGFAHLMSKDLRLYESDSLDSDSFLGPLHSLGLDYQRLISGMKQGSLQEKQWADKHFMEGLKFMKAQRPELALEHFTTAKSFNKNSSKIYIARGCALANMNNFSEGIREIRQALRLSPDNKEAHKYLQDIRKEMRQKQGVQEEASRSKKIRVGNDFEPYRRQ